MKKAWGAVTRFLGDNVLPHAGRLTIMVPGLVVLGWTLVRTEEWNNTKVGLWIGAGVILLIAGYLAPVIKSVTLEFLGNKLHIDAERQRVQERTDEGVHTSGELDELEAGTQPGPSGPVDEDEVLGYARILAASAGLRQMLSPSEGPLAGCELHVYLFDGDQGGLVRSTLEEHTERGESEPPWQPGVGVVGTAWTTAEIAVAVGSQASDGTSGLDEEQRKRHATLSAVAAAPIVNDSGRPIGVLSASERNAAEGTEILATQEAQAELVGLATIVARYLVDLLGWFRD